MMIIMMMLLLMMMTIFFSVDSGNLSNMDKYITWLTMYPHTHTRTYTNHSKTVFIFYIYIYRIYQYIVAPMYCVRYSSAMCHQQY